jgi:hypothetical protein
VHAIVQIVGPASEPDPKARQTGFCTSAQSLVSTHSS